MLRSVRVGCIPVVFSDAYEMYAPSFPECIKLSDFSIFIPEEAFLKDPLAELSKLATLSQEFLEEKMRGLTFAQLVLMPDHPESLFVPAFLLEAQAANDHARPEPSAAEYRKTMMRFPSKFIQFIHDERGQAKIVYTRHKKTLNPTFTTPHYFSLGNQINYGKS